MRRARCHSPRRKHATFAIWLPANKRTAKEFAAAVDAWFRLMLPDVPPGPKWLHEIAMVDYDFLSDDGQGWERDLRALASWLKPAERRRVALCLHGWYDALGSYCYDAQSHSMKQEWIAFERTRKVRFTQAELKRRLRLARDLGFRVLLYFGDGLAADSGVPGYHDDWAYRDAKGNKVTGWQGPDTFGATYMRNVAHPEVFSWFTNYLARAAQDLRRRDGRLRLGRDLSCASGPNCLVTPARLLRPRHDEPREGPDSPGPRISTRRKYF